MFYNSFQRLVAAARPTREWGPAKIPDRELVDYVPGFIVNPWQEMPFDLHENGLNLLAAETELPLKTQTL